MAPVIVVVEFPEKTLLGMESPVQKVEADNDQLLVDRARLGDRHAFDLLVLKYQSRLLSLVIRLVSNQSDALDVLQDTFVKAYRSLNTFRGESAFYTWLYRIAMNLAIDHTRKRKRREVAGFDESVATKDADGGIDAVHHGDSPSKALERKQLLRRIMDGMQKLSDDQRQVILLREVEGLSYKEISEVMEIPEGTVMSRLFYARKKLQKILSEDAA